MSSFNNQKEKEICSETHSCFLLKLAHTNRRRFVLVSRILDFILYLSLMLTLFNFWDIIGKKSSFDFGVIYTIIYAIVTSTTLIFLNDRIRKKVMRLNEQINRANDAQ